LRGSRSAAASAPVFAGAEAAFGAAAGFPPLFPTSAADAIGARLAAAIESAAAQTLPGEIDLIVFLPSRRARLKARESNPYPPRS
jgi:hypothetical protein